MIAIGSPFGLAQTVTVGIISAKGRKNVRQDAMYKDFLQTDAALNRGNSGGPLLNLKAEVIGINTAIASQHGGFDGIGFAIPINMAREVAEELIRTGKVVRGWLGIVMESAASSHDRILVRAVLENSPAAREGMRPGDHIVSYDGKTGLTMSSLQRAVARTLVGRRVEMVVERGGKRRTLRIKVGLQP